MYCCCIVGLVCRCPTTFPRDNFQAMGYFILKCNEMGQWWLPFSFRKLQTFFMGLGFMTVYWCRFLEEEEGWR